jgi:ribonucleoside-diphosphate reductase beta chain
MSNVDLPIKIFNANKSDYDSNEIILGQEPGLFDSINNHHPILFNLYKRLKMMDWDENEFPYADCLHEFETCDRTSYEMMIKTLAWQWEADATASRAIVNILGPVMTDSRVWAGYVLINSNENLHALTYSEIVRNSFKNPQVILDEILKVQEAQERLVTVAKVMGEAHDASHAYACGTIPNDQDLYNKIFKFFMALYYLERVQFMASFAVTFAFGKMGRFQPIVMGVQKIAIDEFEIHAQFGQEVIKALLKTERGRLAYEQTKEECTKLYWEVLMSEVRWLMYLFSEGRELPGVTLKKMIQWVLFNGNAAGIFTGHKGQLTEAHYAEFLEVTGFELEWPEKNPLPYMTEYLDLAANQTSPQEVDNNQYMVNALDTSNEQAEFEVDFLD